MQCNIFRSVMELQKQKRKLEKEFLKVLVLGRKQFSPPLTYIISKVAKLL